MGKQFSMGEELCRLHDVGMRMHFIPYRKTFSHNLALLRPLNSGEDPEFPREVAHGGGGGGVIKIGLVGGCATGDSTHISISTCSEGHSGR